MIFTMSELEYTVSFMTCSEIEDIGFSLAARTALLDDALRVPQEKLLFPYKILN